MLPWIVQQIAKVVLDLPVVMSPRLLSLSLYAGAEDMSAKTAWGHLALTLLQQSHLCPLPLLAQPIFWHHDTGLSLYPLPHALLLADASPAQEFTHLGCKVVNPVGGA